MNKLKRNFLNSLRCILEYETVVTFLIFVSLYHFSTAENKNFIICQSDTKKLISCDKGLFISIRWARYGHIANQNNCYDIGKKECTVDVTSFIKQKCDYKASCHVFHNYEDLMNELKKISCEKELISLDGQYDCEDYHQTQQLCHHQPIIVKDNQGQFFSNYTNAKNIGSDLCPWKFELAESQNLSLEVITTTITNNDNFVKVETSDSKIFNLQSNSKKSITNVQNVEVVLKNDKFLSYVVKFKVSGCPRINLPHDVEEKARNSSHIELQCISNSQLKITIECSKDQRLQQRVREISCSAPTAATVSNFSENFYQILLIVVVLMIAFVISVVIILIGCYCLKVKIEHPPQHDYCSQRHKYSVENIDYPPICNSSYSISMNDPYYLTKRDYAAQKHMRQMSEARPDYIPCCPTHGPYATLATTVDRPYKTLYFHKQRAVGAPNHHISANDSYQMRHSMEGALNKAIERPESDVFYHELDHFNDQRFSTAEPIVNDQDVHTLKPDNST